MTWFVSEMIDDVLTDILTDESSSQSPASHLISNYSFLSSRNTGLSELTWRTESLR